MKIKYGFKTEPQAVTLLFLLILLLNFSLTAGAKEKKLARNSKAVASPQSLNGPAKGIFWMVNLPSSAKVSERTIATLERNNCLDGIFIRIHWNNIEKSNGEYEWDQLDWAINLARKYDLQYKVMLLPGQNTPEWVYEEGAEAFQTTFPWPMRNEYGQVTKIPLPWDSVYQHYFRRMLKKFGVRYGNDKHFVALTLTGVNFVYGEMHLPKTREDIARWKTYEDYPTRIEGVYKELTDFYANTFLRQQMVLHITMPIPGMAQNVDNIVRYGLNKYPDRFTLQNAQLTGHQNNDRMFSYRIISKYKDQAHIGFQSLNSFVAFRERVGSPEVATYNFVNAGAEFWELLVPDGLDETFTCRLSEMIEKARSMGAEAYLKELEKTGQFENVNGFTERRQRMQAFQEDGDYEEALIILNETFRFTYNDISKKVKLIQQVGRTEDAFNFLKSVIMKRNTAAFHEMLADEYADAGKMEDAVESYEQAYLRSKNSRYLIKKGRLYAENNMYSDAADAWMRFLEAEGRTQEAYERVANLYRQFGFEHNLNTLQNQATRDGYNNILNN